MRSGSSEGSSGCIGSETAIGAVTTGGKDGHGSNVFTEHRLVLQPLQREVCPVLPASKGAGDGAVGSVGWPEVGAPDVTAEGLPQVPEGTKYLLGRADDPVAPLRIAQVALCPLVAAQRIPAEGGAGAIAGC